MQSPPSYKKQKLTLFRFTPFQDEEMTKSIECHFNWYWATDIIWTEQYLNDRIIAIEKSIEEGDNRNLPQLYALKGFFCTKLYELSHCETENNLKTAVDSFQTASNHCNENKNLGYIALITGCQEYVKNKFKTDNPVIPTDQNELKASHNAEILAMQGHTPNYFHKISEAIHFYEQALLKFENEPPAEWLYGLALALSRQNVGRETSSEMERIDLLLRDAIDTDPGYHFAKLKLVKHLFDSRNKTCDEEINYYVDQVYKNVKDENEDVSLLEEVAFTIKEMHPVKAKEIYEKCYQKNKESKKTLRGLGECWYDEWEGGYDGMKGNKVSNDECTNRDNESLVKAVTYFEENVGIEGKNDMLFDISRIMNVHRQAYNYYNSKEEPEKAEHHKTECKRHKTSMESRVETADARDKVELCFRLSEYYLTFPYENKEVEYLMKTLECSKEPNLKELRFIKFSQNRLLTIASNEQPDANGYQSKSKMFECRGEIGSAIF